MSLWLLLPVKPLTRGKSRLAGILGAKQRRALNERLVLRTIDVARAFLGSDSTILVSGCDDALALAREHGLTGLRETGPLGLNRALRQASGEARNRGATAIMTVSCDLPFLEARDLRELAAAAGAASDRVVIASDRHHTGTNAMLVPAAAEFRFRFGLNSLRRHRHEAERLGLSSITLDRFGLAFDIDTPEDYQAIRGAHGLGETTYSTGFVPLYPGH